MKIQDPAKALVAEIENYNPELEERFQKSGQTIHDTDLSKGNKITLVDDKGQRKKRKAADWIFTDPESGDVDYERKKSIEKAKIAFKKENRKIELQNIKKSLPVIPSDKDKKLDAGKKIVTVSQNQKLPKTNTNTKTNINTKISNAIKGSARGRFKPNMMSSLIFAGLGGHMGQFEGEVPISTWNYNERAMELNKMDSPLAKNPKTKHRQRVAL